MMKRITTQLSIIFLLAVLTGCTSILELLPSSTEVPISHQFTNTYTVEPTLQTDTPTPIPPSQTPTPTFTPTIQEITMTPTNDLVATIAALQATLEASAKQIATLESEKSSSPSSPSSPTSSSSSKSTTPNLPTDVRQVTVIQRANLRISKRNNAVGKPIMSIPKSSRIVLVEGSQQYIYKDRVDADGSVVYYEIYDPDGFVTQVLYIRAVDIQIRTSRYNTSFGPIPEGVVLSEVITSKAVMRFIKEYNYKGKPIMKIVDPRIVLEKGDQTWIYPSPIISDGGNPFYEIYDPDGSVTNVLFARVEDLYIINALDQ